VPLDERLGDIAGESIDIAKVATMALADHDVSDAAQLGHAAPPPSGAPSQSRSRGNDGRREWPSGSAARGRSIGEPEPSADVSADTFGAGVLGPTRTGGPLRPAGGTEIGLVGVGADGHGGAPPPELRR
jgi:hypothetical protein